MIECIIIGSGLLLIFSGTWAACRYDDWRENRKFERRCAEDKERQKKQDAEKFLQHLEKHGTDRDKARVKAIRELEKEVRLRIIESEQVSRILDNKLVREKMESAAIEIEEFKLMLSGHEDELLKKFEELERTMDVRLLDE